MATSTTLRPRLRVTSGPLRGASFPLIDGITIGRGFNVDILLLAPGVSARHACLRQTADGGFRIVDLQSKTGTWSDGARVDELRLRDGIAFEIGGTRFEYAPAPAIECGYAMHRHERPLDRTFVAMQRVATATHPARPSRSALADRPTRKTPFAPLELAC